MRLGNRLSSGYGYCHRLGRTGGQNYILKLDLQTETRPFPHIRKHDVER